MENPRTDSARDHDDSAIIHAASDAPAHADRSGGKLARDVATQAELDSVADPDGTTRATKQDDIDNDAAQRSNRVPG